MSKNYQVKVIQKIKKDYKKTHERHQNISKEEKEKEQQYGHERYKNLSEDEKQELVEYRKKHYRMKKMSNYTYKRLLF